jgi:hypothetical protein
MADIELPTRVGRAERGDNRFRGRSVADELAGKVAMAGLFALAVGRELSAEHAAVLDDLAGCCLAADPRIWPLKIVRVAASHGDPEVGLCAAILSGPGRHGPSIVAAAAELLLAVGDEVAGGSTPRDAIARRLASATARLPGFGVISRTADERVVAVAACLRRRGREGGRMWSLLEQMDEATFDLRNTRVNIAGALAAALLDLGLAPREIRMVMHAVLLPNFLANAAEGAEQAPEVLQRMPEEAVRYVGPPPRQSPRAVQVGAHMRLLRLGEG